MSDDIAAAAENIMITCLIDLRELVPALSKTVASLNADGAL